MATHPNWPKGLFQLVIHAFEFVGIDIQGHFDGMAAIHFLFTSHHGIKNLKPSETNVDTNHQQRFNLQNQHETVLYSLPEYRRIFPLSFTWTTNQHALEAPQDFLPVRKHTKTPRGPFLYTNGDPHRWVLGFEILRHDIPIHPPLWYGSDLVLQFYS